MMKILCVFKEKICILLCLGMLTGCVTSPHGESLVDNGFTSPVSVNLGDHNDILIPIELAVEKTRSVKTASFHGGMYKTEGKIEIRSLKSYLVTSFSNAGWELVGEADYDRIMLAFVKESKTCLLMIYNDSSGSYGNTHADFYVTDNLANKTVAPILYDRG